MADLQTELERFASLAANIDVFFLIINATVIYFMQCGFAILECGAVRSKNATNILIKNMLDSLIGAICYWLIGYALAFGKGNAFCGDRYWASSGGFDDFAHVFFHYTFAVTASTIVSGSVAERCNFSAYIIYSTVFTAFMYPIVSHWAWAEEGWLSQGLAISRNNETFTATFQDFAGSGVVHLVGGTAALFGALLLGPRIGRFDTDLDDAEELRGHSVPMAALGGFILFLGFFSFNGSSQGHISQPGDGLAVAGAVWNTILAGAFGALFSVVAHLFLNYYSTKHWKWSLLTTINGGLSGMVAICAGCNNVYPWAAAVIGSVSGLILHLVSWLMIKVKIDDPLDAVAVHLGSGLWGVIAVALFNKTNGVFLFGHIESAYALGINLLGALAIFVWSAGVSGLVFGSLRLIKILRVPRQLEIEGLDVPEHGEPAYPVSAYRDTGMVDHLQKVFDELMDKEMGEERAANPQLESAIQAFRRASLVLVNGALAGRAKPSDPGSGRSKLPPIEVIYEDDSEEEEEEKKEEEKEEEMKKEVVELQDNLAANGIQNDEKVVVVSRI